MSELVLSTTLRESAQELTALRVKQGDRFEAISKETDPDKKSALKIECKAALEEITVKSQSFDDDLELARQEQSNRDAIKNMSAAAPRTPFATQTSSDRGAQLFSGAQAQRPMTLGAMLTESDQWKHGMPGVKSSPFNVELDLSQGGETDGGNIKTTMTTAAGWAPYGPRLVGFIPSAQRIPSFADLIPQEDTQSPLFYYMEETTFTNNAAYTAEGATKPESAFALTSRTVTASKIATTLPVSEEQMEDVPQIRTYIDNRGTFQIQLAEEDALLNWTSGANGWDGFLQKAGVQTQAKGADPIPTAVLKAMVKVQYSPGFAGVSTGIAMNPSDWQAVLTLQETTGAYIWSMPSAPTEMPDMRMWGQVVRPTPAMTVGTALLGNFRGFSQIWRRSNLSIRVAYANDDALKNLMRIIFEERLALVISRAAAFCKLTGLNV